MEIYLLHFPDRQTTKSSSDETIAVSYTPKKYIVFNIIVCDTPASMDIGLDHHLCFRLYVASRLIVQGYGERLVRLGLTYPKYLVLLSLSPGKRLTVNELGEMLSLDSGTLSPLLKSLLSAGFIKRDRLALDERTVVNYLTPKGKRLCEEGKKIAYDLYQETGLSKDEHNQLCSVMDDYVLRCKKILNQRSQSELKNCKPRKNRTACPRINPAKPKRNSSPSVNL